MLYLLFKIDLTESSLFAAPVNLNYSKPALFREFQLSKIKNAILYLCYSRLIKEGFKFNYSKHTNLMYQLDSYSTYILYNQKYERFDRESVSEESPDFLLDEAQIDDYNKRFLNISLKHNYRPLVFSPNIYNFQKIPLLSIILSDA